MLPRLLLWQAYLFEYHQFDEPSPTEYLAPSWSWATDHQSAMYLNRDYPDDGGFFEWQGELISAHVTPKYDSLPYGPVDFAYLRLRARFRRAHYERATSERTPSGFWWVRLDDADKMTWYPRGMNGRRRYKWYEPCRASIDP